MGRPKLVIWGAGGHAGVVADIIRSGDDYEIAGFLDDVTPGRSAGRCHDAPLWVERTCLPELRRDGVEFLIVAMGDCHARLRLAAAARDLGFSLATAVHPSAILASQVRIGAGSVIAAGSVVCVDVSLGENVIVNTCASVDHGSVIGDGAHVGPGARVGGRVILERAVFEGMGAIIVAGVRIGANSVIGAGAVVLSDIPEGVVAYGVPAKVRREVGADA